MFRIDGPGATQENEFTEGDPANGTRATVVTAEWLNALQEELARTIEDDGYELDKSNNGQLSKIIRNRPNLVGSVAELKASPLSEGSFVIVRTDAVDRPKNGRYLYVIKALAPDTLADGAQIISLDNGLFAVAQQTISEGYVPFSVSRINMHFGALKGIPWNQNETGGSSTYTLASGVVPGDHSITLNSVTGLVADQLICYEANNGQYYSTVIREITGNTLALRAPIEATVSAGGSFHNFYINSSHANPFGFYTITDYALRELTHTYRKVAQINPSDFKSLTGPEAVTLSTAEDIYAPGSSSNEYAHVLTTGGIDEGVVTEGFYELPEGLYFVRGYVNPGSVNAGAAENQVQLAVSQTRGAVTQTVAQLQRTGHDCTREYGFFFYAGASTTQRFTVRSRVSAAGEFEVGKIEIFRVENTITNLDNSKHVMLGDSWYAFGDIQDRITDRLPNAVVFQEGVGGNTAAQISARFDTDVATKKPDYVWIMCGTNDYFQNVSIDSFEFHMNVLKEKIAAIGAIAIFFDPSVGEIDNGAEPQNFDLSRSYALRGTYSQADVLIEPALNLAESETFVYESIAPGETRLVYMPPGTTVKAYRILNSFFNDSGLTIKAGFRSNIGVPNESVESYVANTLVSPSSPVTVGPPASFRFMSIAIENTTGATINAVGYLKLSYSPS